MMATKRLLALLVLAGCAAEPLTTATTTNPKIQIGLLFKVEGCRVYRFADAGEYRYITICGPVDAEQPPLVVVSSQDTRTRTTSNGKTTTTTTYTVPWQIQTVQK